MVGKSSLVNALVGDKVAEEWREKADKVITHDVEGAKVRVWDSLGLMTMTTTMMMKVAQVTTKSARRK